MVQNGEGPGEGVGRDNGEMWTDVRSSLGVKLSRLADLFIQFINSTVSGSVDAAAHKTSKNVLI